MCELVVWVFADFIVLGLVVSLLFVVGTSLSAGLGLCVLALR